MPRGGCGLPLFESPAVSCNILVCQENYKRERDGAGGLGGASAAVAVWQKLAAAIRLIKNVDAPP